MGRGKNFQPDSVSAREASATAAPETHVPSPSGPCPFNASTDTIVQEFGPCIPGEHKWLGAAVAEDGSIWGVPSNNRRVVKVVPGTGEVTTHGEALGTREYKYLRGIRTLTGTILGIPAWADRVLEITPATGEVTTIGNLQTPQQKNLKKWKWMWHGAAAGLDGNIYGIPSNADAVLFIDPRTKEVSTFGEGLLPEGTNKWYGGIRGPDGCVYGMPYKANGVLKITPETKRCEILGDFSSVEGGWKWLGGVLAPNGCIYAFPSHAPRVLKIDCAKGTTEMIGPAFPGKYKWGGGTCDLNGNVFGMPSDTDCVLRIDTTDDTVTTIGKGRLGPDIKNKWQGAVLAPDGCLYAGTFAFPKSRHTV